mgnify:CR=1 FL=1
MTILDFMKKIKDFSDDKYPGFFKKNEYKSKISNAQEAHECIRPVKLDGNNNLDDYEEKLLNIIKERTISSQMKKYKEDVYVYTLIALEDNTQKFNFTLKITTDIGYKIINNTEKNDDTKL